MAVIGELWMDFERARRRLALDWAVMVVGRSMGSSFIFFKS